MPIISFDCLLVSITHVAASAVAIAKILKQIWAPRTIFWVLRAGFFGNLASKPSIVWFLWKKQRKRYKKPQKKQGRNVEGKEWWSKGKGWRERAWSYRSTYRRESVGIFRGHDDDVSDYLTCRKSTGFSIKSHFAKLFGLEAEPLGLGIYMHNGDHVALSGIKYSIKRFDIWWVLKKYVLNLGRLDSLILDFPWKEKGNQ